MTIYQQKGSKLELPNRQYNKPIHKYVHESQNFNHSLLVMCIIPNAMNNTPNS